MGQRNPAPVEHCGKHPIIYRVSTIQVVQDFLTTHRTNLVILQTENWRGDVGDRTRQHLEDGRRAAAELVVFQSYGVLRKRTFWLSTEMK